MEWAFVELCWWHKTWRACADLSSADAHIARVFHVNVGTYLLLGWRTSWRQFEVCSFCGCTLARTSTNKHASSRVLLFSLLPRLLRIASSSNASWYFLTTILIFPVTDCEMSNWLTIIQGEVRQICCCTSTGWNIMSVARNHGYNSFELYILDIAQSLVTHNAVTYWDIFVSFIWKVYLDPDTD